MVAYLRGPAYKVAKLPIPPAVAKAYGKDLIFWGGAAAAGVATFTTGWPLFKETFYQKIPVFGSYFEYNPDPEEIPV